ncbi:MAG: hypothetical protein D3908_09205 [Candidatus Electrothrix sp. AUS4]|nr:hypothetical protein [Candidatus Electrothrix sp. AUS4]
MVASRKKAARPAYKKKVEEAELPTEQETEELLWGINAVHEALRRNARSLSELLIQKGKAGPKVQELIDLAREGMVRVRFVEVDRLPVPRNCRHQGVVARRTEAEFLSLEELLAESLADTGRILILDSIQDPRNLGSILRSALAAGFRSIILTRERSAPLSGTVARHGPLSQLIQNIFSHGARVV